MATNAADAYGLTTRGLLAPGKAADLCIISPLGLTERTTYETPTLTATGLARVLVNGAVVWRAGKVQAAGHPGKLIHH